MHKLRFFASALLVFSVCALAVPAIAAPHGGGGFHGGGGGGGGFHPGFGGGFRPGGFGGFRGGFAGGGYGPWYGYGYWPWYFPGDFYGAYEPICSFVPVKRIVNHKTVWRRVYTCQ